MPGHAGLQEFLKKFSSVPNTFIDEMFALYDPDTSQTDFVVNLEAVATWLKTTKRGMVKTLRESYKEGIDYEVSSAPAPHVSGKYGRNAYKLVMLTPDCFKRLCMRSRGETAEDVRSYFIAVETLVTKYRTQMADGMAQQIRELESGRHARGLERASGADRSGYIYVLRASARYDTVVKIGRTKDLARRLREHGAALADDPEVLLVYHTEDAEAVETCIKGWLKTRQWPRARYKEVYRADVDMVKQLVHKCGSAGAVLKRRPVPRHPKGRLAGGGAAGDLFIMLSKEPR